MIATKQAHKKKNIMTTLVNKSEVANTNVINVEEINTIEEIALYGAIARKDERVKALVNSTNLIDIMFGVTKQPIEKVIEGYTAISEYDHFVIGDFKQPKILNACSKKYQLIPNFDIIPLLMYILFDNNVSFDVKCAYNDNKTQFNIMFKFNSNDNAITMANGDVIFPQITVTHSYDGKLQYGLIFGFFRLICSNGLTVPVKGLEHLGLTTKGKHTTSIIESFRNLVSKLGVFVANKDVLLLPYQTMQTTIVDNLNERILYVLEKAKISNVADKALIHVQRVINGEMSQLGIERPTDWLIYNAVNHYTFNENKKNIEVRTKIDRAVIDTMVEMYQIADDAGNKKLSARRRKVDETVLHKVREDMKK